MTSVDIRNFLNPGVPYIYGFQVGIRDGSIRVFLRRVMMDAKKRLEVINWLIVQEEDYEGLNTLQFLLEMREEAIEEISELKGNHE